MLYEVITSLLADTSIEKGKSIDLFKDSFMEGIKRLEKEVVSKWKLEAGQTAIPVDVEGADLLYVALAGAHSIIPAAAVFNAARITSYNVCYTKLLRHLDGGGRYAGPGHPAG